MNASAKKIKRIIEEELRLILLTPQDHDIEPADVTDAWHPSDVVPIEDAWAGGDNIEDPLDHAHFETGESNAGPHASVGLSYNTDHINQACPHIRENTVKITHNQLRNIIQEELMLHIKPRYVISESRTSDAVLSLIHDGLLALKRGFQKMDSAASSTLAGMGYDPRSARQDLITMFSLTRQYKRHQRRRDRGEITSERLEEVRASLAEAIGGAFTSFMGDLAGSAGRIGGTMLGLMGALGIPGLVESIGDLVDAMTDNRVTTAMAQDFTEFLMGK